MSGRARGDRGGRFGRLLSGALVAALPALAGCLSFHTGPMPGEPKGAHFAKVEGARVRYIDKGQGSPVVLIHGFASALDVWTTVVPELAKTHRVIAMDLKGFGWTDRPEGDYSPAAEAALVAALLDQLGVKQAALVAHSWGSSVALALALAKPDLVTKIALYDAWVYEEQLPTTFLFARADGVGELIFSLFYDQRPDERMALAFYDKNVVSERLIEEVEEALARPGTAAAALAAVRGQRFTEQQAKYKTIDKPTLLLWGREDVVTTLKYGERLSKELPRARLVVYPQCGHFPMIEAKAPSTIELATFLSDGDPRGVASVPPVETPKPGKPADTDAPATGSPKSDAPKSIAPASGSGK